LTCEKTVRQQAKLTAPLFTTRQQTVSKIPNFWPLVLEQAPPDIDQYIQPSDSALLLSSLTSFSVSRFEAPLEPRSLSIRFEFSENEYFEDKVLEKRFWFRRAKDGWQGLVSEPVVIAWKKDRDLTGGLLDMVQKAYVSAPVPKTSKDYTLEQKSLQKKIDNTGMGGLSFFAWFGFIGRRISAEENTEAIEQEKKRRETGAKVEVPEVDEEDEDEELDMRLEIFPDGEELALAFADDLWVGAIKYFSMFLTFLLYFLSPLASPTSKHSPGELSEPLSSFLLIYEMGGMG
jgi:hypothetical protein